ncbi:MAG: hypothetical protein ACE5EK_00940, partial [Nitrospinales bacterium]
MDKIDENENIKKQHVDAVPKEDTEESPCISRRKLLMTGGKLGGLAAMSVLIPSRVLAGSVKGGMGSS